MILKNCRFDIDINNQPNALAANTISGNCFCQTLKFNYRQLKEKMEGQDYMSTLEHAILFITN
jgi:hypothetical protein